MKLKFFDAQTLDRNLKATIHKSGKLGFTIEAAKKMALNDSKSIAIATDEEDIHDRNLYAVVYDDVQKGAFKVGRGGQYYYINTKPLFDSLKMDYVKEWIQFEISQIEIEGQKVFKFSQKEKTVKQSGSSVK